jgi:hypothetical protein
MVASKICSSAMSSHQILNTLEYAAEKHELIFIQNLGAQGVLYGKVTGVVCTAYAMMSAENGKIYKTYSTYIDTPY